MTVLSGSATGDGQHGSFTTIAAITHVFPNAIFFPPCANLSIDHRFLLVTSANFSWSAENANLEFGLLVDNPNLAESVERELREAEDLLFERVQATSASGR